MSFSEQVKEVQSKIKPLMDATKMMTPEILEAMKKVSAIDWDAAKDACNAHNQVMNNMQLVEVVVNGLPDIKSIVEIQNQVRYVSDIRDSIGLVAGIDKNKIKELLDMKALMTKVVNSNISEDMINKLLPLLEEVLMMKGEIKETAFIAERLRDDIFKLEKASKSMSESEMSAANMLQEMRIAEHRIDEKLKRIESIDKSMKEFDVLVTHVGPEVEPASRYDNIENILKISIPSGKQGKRGEKGIGKQGKQGVPGSVEYKGDKGERGDKGKDGKDFSATGFGTKTQRARFNNTAEGTSYVSLDEIPAMIYFRIGNNSSNWTEGQPFGWTEGLRAGTAENSEKFGGYTPNEFLKLIQKFIEEDCDV